MPSSQAAMVVVLVCSSAYSEAMRRRRLMVSRVMSSLRWMLLFASGWSSRTRSRIGLTRANNRAAAALADLRLVQLGYAVMYAVEFARSRRVLPARPANIAWANASWRGLLSAGILALGCDT